MAYDTLGRLPDPSFGGGPGWVSQQIIDNTPGMIHNLNSGASVSVKFSGNYWTISLSYPQLTIAEMNTILPFLYSLQGAFTNFYVQSPLYVNPAAGAWAAVPLANTVGQGTTSNEVDITGWAAAISAAGSTLVVGDMIKFTDIKKIYLITGTSLNTDVMTLTLNADLTTAISTSTLEPNDIKFRVRIDGATPAFSINADGLYEGFTLKLRENTL